MARGKNFTRRGGYSGATEDGVIAIADSYRKPGQAVSLDVPIDRILPNPFQARKTFDGIEELAAAIRTQGFVTRLRVRTAPGKPGYYELVYGERRLRAAQAVGLTMIPCDAVEYSSKEMIEIGLMENIPREELHPLEEAQAFRALIDQGDYSIRSLAERIGKDKSYVEERLAVLHAPADVQQMLEQRPDAPLRVAREIAKLPTAQDRKPLIDGVITGSLTRDDVIAQVRQAGSSSTRTKPASRDVSIPERDQAGVQRPLDRALDRDVSTLKGIFARWRQAAPNFDEVQKQRVLTYIDAHLRELEEFTKLLQK